ncbi:GIY-YIG nuclease family protein [Brevundimonas naejangsanensis]|uniref:GIY-YIG nuclease family protein n=1 Tax=Brevundimonas naejangsanensis TaxID=588932 RepID=A0A494RGV1_9CAUL|nr:GIY-YIG nuclease family protein [Brevundimonas naejangsanensis]AYG95655.1 GIY-YIG nuclease family protein [Brevundimonas naejangsanensis]
MSIGKKGRSLELFFVDGRPEGIVTAGVFNWAGHVLVTPRARLKEALERPSSRLTGVYILVGEKNGKLFAYIGEAENVANRIKIHGAKKDWWTSAFLVTSSDNSLNKAHAKYLEARLVEEALKVGAMSLENGNAPPKPGLSESGAANMEAFLEFVFLVLPAVRLDMFVQHARPTIQKNGNNLDKVLPSDPQKFLINTQKHNLKAEAFLIDGEFVVQAGSQARLVWMGKERSTSGYAKLHEQLIQSRILQPSGKHCIFTESCAFNSASAAAAIVYGRQTQGPAAWKTPEGKTYKQWEAEQL